MTRRRYPGPLLMLLVVGVEAACAQNADPPDGLESKIDAIFSRYDRTDSPGCAIGVVKDGELVLASAYGMADLEHGVPLTPSSAFHLASETKQFTAATLLTAVAAGELSLDDDVRDHVPELPDYGHVVTLRHLLHHTSGVRDYATLWVLSGETHPHPHTADDTLALLAAQRALNFPPGSDTCYSNSGYFLLGVALERATGRTLAELAGERLFAPLGMRDTRYVDDHTDLVPNRAVGHLRRAEGGFGRASSVSSVVGARGLVSTVNDLARWEAAFSGHALGDSIVERLLTPGRLNDGTELPYAAGLVLDDFDGLLAVSHGGEGDGSSTFLLRFPEIHLGVVCLCNVSNAGAAGLAWRSAVAHLFGPYREETARHQTPAAPPGFVSLPREVLEGLAGAYRDARTRAVWTVAVGEGALTLDSGGGYSVLRPLGEQRFRSPGPGQTVQVTFADDAMRVEVEGQHPSVLRKVELVVPVDVSLAVYEGEYWSEELLVPWTLEAREGRLHFAAIGAPPEAFVPTLGDEFALGASLRISFSRNAAGEIVALAAHTDRVWDLRFERR